MKNLEELNTKYESIKFEYQISKTSNTLLDTEVYIWYNKLYPKISKKTKQKKKKKRSSNVSLNTLNL